MTLGKQIAQNRKRLGLTQDALADRLGVTAQAVSKWENDQSCPDISTLPKLADLFGVSVDELLGREYKTAHTVEVVSDGDGNEESQEESKGWEFHWDSGRKDAVFFAIFVLLVGGLMLAAKLLQWQTGFWDILWPCGLLVFGLSKLFGRFSFFGIGCTLFGGYFLLENLQITKLDIAGELVFPVLIVIFGLSLLADAMRKPKKPRFSIHHGKNHSSKSKHQFSVDGDSFDCSLSFGNNEHLITLPCLSGGEVNCSFGELRIDLSGCDSVSEDCTLDVSCSFGELELLVPKRYRITTDISTTFGDMDIAGQPDAATQEAIHLSGNVSFGQISIRYI